MALPSSALYVELPILLIIIFAINASVDLSQSPQKASMVRAMAKQTRTVGTAPYVAPWSLSHITTALSVVRLQSPPLPP